MNRQLAVIVDMDGTLCDVSTVIHLQAEPDGFTAFHEGCAQCPPNQTVVDWCLEHHSRGHEILVVTGRDAWTRGLTTQWLSEHLPVPFGGLFMRSDGDLRSNADVKREIHGRLAVTYDIRAAIDDDPQIVELWREIGIPVTMVFDWYEEGGVDMTSMVFDGGEGCGEKEYQRWLHDHGRGFVINILRGYKQPEEARLHCADCVSISDSTMPYVTGAYVKVCGDRRADLQQWARNTVGTEIELCKLPSCFGF